MLSRVYLCHGGNYNHDKTVVTPYFCIQLFFKTNDIKERLVFEFPNENKISEIEQKYGVDPSQKQIVAFYVCNVKYDKCHYSSNSQEITHVRQLFENLRNSICISEETIRETFEKYPSIDVKGETDMYGMNPVTDPEKTIIYTDKHMKYFMTHVKPKVESKYVKVENKFVEGKDVKEKDIDKINRIVNFSKDKVNKDKPNQVKKKSFFDRFF